MEQEIKFMMESPEKALHLLLESGALARNERTFEDNLVLDDAGRGLAKRGVLLRLRRYGDAATLTVKTGAEVREGLKVREELEIRVGDFDGTLALLETLGYLPVFRYQKYRPNFDFMGTVVSLDETPIGTYLEIEGEADAVGAAASALGLALNLGLTHSYVQLYRALRQTGDMVFT